MPTETSILQSRLFSYNCLPSTFEVYTAPKLSHVDFSFSQSGSFHKALDIEQKAKFGQKKLALNKTNESFAWVNIFAQLVRQRYQLLIFLRLTDAFYVSLWTGALYSAYLLDTSGHRRSCINLAWAAVICKSVRPQQQLFAQQSNSHSHGLKLVSARFWMRRQILIFLPEMQQYGLIILSYIVRRTRSRRYGKRAFLFCRNVWPSCYVMSQYHSFVIMLSGAGVTRPT